MRNRRSSSFQFGSQEEESLLNLTPLIDVVFVVLIIFILIAPMLEIDKVKLASASSDSKQTAASTSSPIAIHVHEDNSIWINQKRASIEELVFFLKQEKVRHHNQTPQLFHDKKAHFGTYQAIKNAVESAGYEELDVILIPGPS
ncbi:MAG: biopolymer transporter ExbD [Verrucomicrobia bacterium]|nr:biopolymer transporter ExbD [Verrucomicrobiota bacterium]